MTMNDLKKYLKNYRGSGAEIQEEMPGIELEQAAWEMAEIELSGDGELDGDELLVLLSTLATDPKGLLADLIYAEMNKAA